MKTIDLNCDLGEGMTTDEQIIPLISSANIACGFHAGNEAMMKQTVNWCMKYGVAVGAHPSWPDREHFGRTEMHMSATELYDIMMQQLNIVHQIAAEQGAILHHVKPHGALYNQSAKDKTIAATIATAVKDFNPVLILYGLSGSMSITEAKAIGLQTASEVFADRTYNDNGSLTARTEHNALIKDETTAIQQAMQMIQQQTVVSTTGKIIPVTADTICIHGDGELAVAFAQTISSAFKQASIAIATI